MWIERCIETELLSYIEKERCVYVERRYVDVDTYIDLAVEINICREIVIHICMYICI